MEITVKLVSPLRSPSGRDEERIECSLETTVRELFRKLEEKLGQEFSQMIFDQESGKVKGNIAICLQREGSPGYQRIELFKGVDTQLQPNDSLIIFYPMGGG